MRIGLEYKVTTCPGESGARWSSCVRGDAKIRYRRWLPAWARKKWRQQGYHPLVCTSVESAGANGGFISAYETWRVLCIGLVDPPPLMHMYPEWFRQVLQAATRAPKMRSPIRESVTVNPTGEVAEHADWPADTMMAKIVIPLWRVRGRPR